MKKLFISIWVLLLLCPVAYAYTINWGDSFNIISVEGMEYEGEYYDVHFDYVDFTIAYEDEPYVYASRDIMPVPHGPFSHGGVMWTLRDLLIENGRWDSEGIPEEMPYVGSISTHSFIFPIPGNSYTSDGLLTIHRLAPLGSFYEPEPVPGYPVYPAGYVFDDMYTAIISPSPVPEPGTVLTFVFGFFTVFASRKLIPKKIRRV